MNDNLHGWVNMILFAGIWVLALCEPLLHGGGW